MAVRKAAVHLCLTLTIKELKFSVAHDRVVTTLTIIFSAPYGHFTAISRHLQNHIVWSPTLECSVKSYVPGPSAKCYFNESLFVQGFIHDTVE